MSKTVELMVAAESFAGNDVSVKRGQQFPSDSSVVIEHPAHFVPAIGGEEAMARRRVAMQHEMEALHERQRLERLEEARRVGTKALNSDDLNAEAIKKFCRTNPDYELVWNDQGHVINARPKKR